MKIAVGISGGVDSALTAKLLLEQGHDVFGIFMINWHNTQGTLYGECPWEDDLRFAQLTCKHLGIDLDVADMSKDYTSRVADYMFAEYAAGRTPNPDVLCNREIKWDVFLNYALDKGADKVATGHYCRVHEQNGVYKLLKGLDDSKDQSYFLCQINQFALSKAQFPIGEYKKEDVRKLAEFHKIPVYDRKDSQGLCFVGKIDLPEFLSQKLKSKKGDILEIESGKLKPLPNWNEIDLNNFEVLESFVQKPNYVNFKGLKVGEHLGSWFYTIGQRKGLGIGGRPNPSFVIALDVENNIVYSGQNKDHSLLNHFALKLDSNSVAWITPADKLQDGDSKVFDVKIRYRQNVQKAILVNCRDNFYILFYEYQQGISPGQFAVWYSGDELIGSGVIN